MSVDFTFAVRTPEERPWKRLPEEEIRNAFFRKSFQSLGSPLALKRGRRPEDAGPKPADLKAFSWSRVAEVSD